jgi:hypothetical protein
VRRGDDAERALDLGTRGEGIGIDLGTCHAILDNRFAPAGRAYWFAVFGDLFSPNKCHDR